MRLIRFAQKSEIPPTGVGELFQILSKNSEPTFFNPTNGSWWILQVLTKVGLEQSTNCRWWD
jgi:hypothetical protein